MNNLSVVNRQPLTVTLPSGTVITYPQELDGGGLEQQVYFLDIIARSQPSSGYSRCFEWCAGFAAIGFELLAQGFCQHLTVSDRYAPAIHTFNHNALVNNLQDRTEAFLSATIRDLPLVQPWDLIVANPPHQFNRDQYIQGLLEYGNHSDISELVDLDTALRLVCDHNLEIHREFFQNISSRITADARIFLSETAVDPQLLALISQSGFQLLAAHHVSPQYWILEIALVNNQ